ncbi:uncharacterized protein LOC128557478 [Mercenaria mercenaria]|uniref:uncharacterized protein LOC128557478 n=1 Tax=Mercenaria mercenaria TaxID=6596 RepID=UPI00234E74F2|nr:uncharacterized protein LOC128557478 [Mercenaria mercenaria]
MKAKVRGIVTQGRWRNVTLDGCCDERVTSFKINWSDDCDIAWVFTAADNARVFEANVIPDAGNEVVVNLFLEPVVGKCFALYVENFNIKPVLRWDVIGCEI